MAIDWYKKYEILCLRHHAQQTGHEVFHWTEMTPDQWLETGYVSSKRHVSKREAYGVDGFAYDAETRTWHAIQAKKNQSDRALTRSDLGSFVSVVDRMRAKDPDSKGYLYSWSGKLTEYVKEDFRVAGYFVHRRFCPDFEDWDDELQAWAERAFSNLKSRASSSDDEDTDDDNEETEDEEEEYEGESTDEDVPADDSDGEEEEEEVRPSKKRMTVRGRTTSTRSPVYCPPEPILRRSSRIATKNTSEN